MAETENHIVEEGGKFRLLSHEGKNLGTFDTRAEAEKHEREVEYFKTKHNATSLPEIFYCNHMLPGVAKYDADEASNTPEEMLYIDADAMKQAAPSMVGVPVYVGHQKVDLANLQAEADGYVVESFYNEVDGWLWAKCIAVSDNAKQAIKNNWSVSNAYVPTEWDGAGQHLNVDYTKKIRNHKFTHLAIVPNPRYEQAKIYSPEQYKAYQETKRAQLAEMQNSNQAKGHPMFKFFQKKDEELKNGLPSDADLTKIEVELENGKRVSLSEMINAVKKNDEDEEKAKKEAEEKEKKEKENKKPTWNEDTEVEVGKEKMSMKDLMGKYNKMKENEADDEEKAKKEADEKKKEKENAEKENAKRFEEMQNAHKKAVHNAPVDTSMDKLKRGQARYGAPDYLKKK